MLPVRSGRVLLARHRYGPPIWALVGGPAEPGEPFETAARGEAAEETGLEVTVGRLLAAADHPERAFLCFAGVAEGTVEPRPEAEEIAELGWFAPDELARRDDVFELARILGRVALRGTPGPWGRRVLDWPDGSAVLVHLETLTPD